ncbi:LysR family transcriptional regulator [Flavivirga spongiicola]|uniref:LysR family transcriptional regulator n=1 Tax=Flavivirga spongiicola TaxID=421621 RepID=A0ABU7XZC0_9FLAO|nr:LysR family transcriptional regulator [Flavivirga sp. MEBiC05379]MDO5980281.1 LysR family transcriptional regulator [Flavivirga sp. MEBiC05379]
MINLEWLRTFSAIYECNNITEASKKLNMTQPGVSKHLSALESHIGKKLFERTTRRLAPTEYGKFLYSQINNPLQELEKVEYYSNQRTKKKRSAITIGCTSDFFKKELIHKIYAFDMYIITHFGNEKDLIEALEMDKIQLLVGIKKHAIYDHQFVYIKSEELELISSNNIDTPKNIEQNEGQFKQWLQRQNWFVLNNDQEGIKKFWETNFNTNFKMVPRYILPSYIDIIEALKNNCGFSIVPKHLCEEALNNSLIKAPIKFSKTTEQKLFYSYKLKNSNLKAINIFIEKMKKTNDNKPHKN